jgi:nucleoside-diphosphate-sugar epimerase
MKALVTGGTGFLGRGIVKALRAQGHDVTAASRHRLAELEAVGARCVDMDLGNPDDVKRAMEGAEVVFHVAAMTGVWGERGVFFRTNVMGTRHVLDACASLGVTKLVYTSSPSVVFNGRDHVNASNDLPYPTTFESAYPETKSIAERQVLEANGAKLATVSLRPHLIYGPGDPHLLPRLIERAKSGRLRVVGDGRNQVSITYIDNAVAGHLAAAQHLEPGAACAGKAYFLCDAEPVVIWQWLGELFARLGIKPVSGKVPLGMARLAGGLAELAWKGMSLEGEPPMTRFIASQLATSHTYDLGPARRDFGYAPPVDRNTALDRTVAWWKAQGDARPHAG